MDLSGAQVASIDNQLYTGDALEPAISVSLNGQDLVLGTDYTVSFSNNVNVGDVATATVNGMGNYTGTATVTFTILPRSLGEAKRPERWFANLEWKRPHARPRRPVR